jgi:hypothetical protein
MDAINKALTQTAAVFSFLIFNEEKENKMAP